MNKLFRLPCVLLAGLALLSACNDDDPEIENQEELITTVRLTFTPTGNTGSQVIATWQDRDGDGGNPPVVSPITLSPNTTYTLAVALSDDSKSPSVNITEEVEEEAEEHQLFFRTTLTGMTIAYNDQDGNNRPLGLVNTVTTPTAGSGTLTVILRHEPNKTATGVAGGDPTNAGGETDIETTPPFSVTVR
jgi:hypothetical protein